MTYNPAGGKTYTLGASISSTATSITLSSFTLPVSGTPITMAILNTDIAYGTIGPKTSSAEFISFTGITQNANGTATLTGVTRGLDKVSPFTTNATYKLPHSGQSIFILSDAPQVFAEYAALRSANTFGPVQEFTLLPTSSGGNAVNPNELVTYAQALAMATGTTNINRIVVAGNGGEAITAGQLVYLLVTDGEWYRCDADTAATVDNIILGIAQGAGSNGVAITNGVLLFGLDSNQTGLTNNTAYYASNTAGAISSTVGTVEVSVGISRSTTSLLFYPRYNQQLTEDQQDALVGTSGTPSASNRYVTDADTTSTPTANRVARFDSSGAVGFDNYIFGDGADGTVTFDGSTTILGMIPAANVYTMTRDIYLINCTINTGVTINTAGYRIFGTGTLTGNGTAKILRNGANGGNGGNGGNGTGGSGGTAGTAGTAGAVLAAGSVGNALAGSNGGAGGSGGTFGSAGGAGNVGSSAGTLANSVGSGSPASASGVAGGAGGGTGAGAAAGAAAANSVTNPVMMPRIPEWAMAMHYMSGATLGYMGSSNSATGGSGGSGGGGGTNEGGPSGTGGGGGGGGAGGSSGGIVCVAFKTIVSPSSSFIQALGGTGGTGGTGGNGVNNGGAQRGGGGGGGGGGTGGTGGIVVCIYKTFSGTTLVESAACAGGSGGTGGTGGAATGAGTGVAGSNGNTGTSGNNGKLYLLAI